jgi:hypothetical protein
MPKFCTFAGLRMPWFSFVVALVMALGTMLPNVLGQDAPASGAPPQSQGAQPPAPIERQQPSQPAAVPPAQAPLPPYSKAIFQKPIPSDQLTFLKQFDGAPADDIIRDKQYRKLMKSFIPDCMFHYGTDKPLDESLEEVLKGSKQPVQIREGRYVLVSGSNGPFLGGRGFMWIDMQDGIALGGFYFRPTNGEPTPTVTVFSRQVREKTIEMSQLPQEFTEVLTEWSAQSRVPQLTTRYFITGSNKRILLAHDEEYCAAGSAASADAACVAMDADAADIDMNTAYYLEQVNYATNAAAWMITGQDQVAWLQVRTNTCRVGPDPLGCRIRMTRERTNVIVHREPVAHGPAGHR